MHSMQDEKQTMRIDNQIRYWAHMLDESSHASYYDVYMQEHPEDSLPKLIDSLIREFSLDLKKDGIKPQKCLRNGIVNVVQLEDLKKKIKTKYYWDRIKAQTYAAIISRMTALFHRAKGQRLSEDDIEFDDVAHLVSRKVIEDCLDKICHNTNVLEANNCIVNSLDDFNDGSRADIARMSSHVDATFKKYGFQKFSRQSSWHGTTIEDYDAIVQLYTVWASYAKGRAGEQYICDSDNGPAELKKVLNSVEYSADTVDLIVALNKSLDVVHFRSDLASAFIEGGQSTCAIVSNLPNKFVI